MLKNILIINYVQKNDNKCNNKLNICYVRVSSLSQKDDLIKQKQYMKNKYPNYIIIEYIGSGLNLNKRGINKIINYGIQGKINKLWYSRKNK